MLKFTVDGQKLELLGDPFVVADSFDFLTGSFKFYSGYDWDLTEKHVFFQLGEATPYEVTLVDDQFIKTDHVNLTTGVWSIYVIGYDIDGATLVERITTNKVSLTAQISGVPDGEPFPPSIIPDVLIVKDQTEEQTFINGIPKLAEDRVISDDHHITDKKFVEDYVDGSHQDHNDLNGLQGGDAGEYYHMTQEQSIVLGNTSGENTGDQSASDFDHGGLTGLQGGSESEHYHMTEAEHAALHAHSNKEALDATRGTNTGDQSADEFNHNDLANKQGGTTNEFYHVTAAEKTVIGNTSGTNTGDQDVSGAISTHNTDAGAHANLGIIDAGGYYDATTVEGALQEAGADISAIQTDITELQNTGVDTTARVQLADIASLNSFDALNATAKKIRSAQHPSTLTMSLMSDTHYNGADANAANKISAASGMGMLGNYANVDAIGNLGDFLRGNEVKDITLSDLNKIIAATNQNTKRPVFYARGNHDDNGWYSHGGYGGTFREDEIISPLEWFQNTFAFCAADIVVDAVNPTGGYGYYDHAPSKIRIFVLNSEDIPYILIDGAYKYNSFSSGHCFSNAQLNFVADALLFADKDVPNDWAALFLMHTPMDTTNTDGYRFGIKDSLIRGHEAMLAIIKAYKNGSSFAFSGSTYNQSLGDTQADFLIDVSADYSAKGCGDVIAFFSGHTHADNFSREVGVTGSLARGYTFLSLTGSTSFANYVIDRANSKIKVVKHGISVPDTTTGAAVGVPDEGTIASGEWAVSFGQFRPTGEDLFAGWDSAGAGYNFDTVSNPPISLDTMEVTGRTISANNILTKAIPVSPFTKYAIPNGFNGTVMAYTSSGTRSGVLTPVPGSDYKIVTTGIRQYYLVFVFHIPTYADYANFKIKETYNGLVF